MKKQLYSKIRFFIIIACVTIGFLANAQSEKVLSIVSRLSNATICINKNETSVVHIATKMFQDDVFNITGQQLTIQHQLPTKGTIIVAGTLGCSELLKQMIRKYKLKTDSVRDRWEAFSIQLIENKDNKLLIVMGSDRRGTAYGILELSRMIGISPWVWWADVKATKKSELELSISKPIYQHPSVQYRGIFLNDEDWGLKPWASKTDDPQLGEIGPKTYRKIFQLLLRLRANTIWPAMHECTLPFYLVNGNATVADSFGIVISTSHCEPMMRSNPREWNHKINGDYNFFTNKTNVLNYWKERLNQVSNYENIYTVGMRGIHDGAMEGVKSMSQHIEGLTNVFSEQRKILSETLHKKPSKIPQIFIPYKEVLDAYNAGLKVPNDVTLVWCDDNYGYLNQLSNEAEKKRSGGSGVYYHVSYWGRPHDYLWLATTEPALLWYEMHLAWSYNARKFWILNVGDLKPAEYLTDFFLDMAWNIDAVRPDNISSHLEKWLAKQFGEEHTAAIQHIMEEYYRLAFIRRPEFMGWSQTEPTTAVHPSALNFTAGGDEVSIRIKQYQDIENQADSIAKLLPHHLKDAYFELIKYPVDGAAEMNKKWLNYQYAGIFAPYGFSETKFAIQKSLSAWEKIQALTSFYNDSIEKGKWKNIMSSSPRNLPVFSKPDFSKISFTQNNHPACWVEDAQKPFYQNDTAQLSINNAKKGLYVFNADSSSLVSKPDWLHVSFQSVKINSFLPSNKWILSLNPEKMTSTHENGILILKLNRAYFYISINGISDHQVDERDHIIRFSASDFTHQNQSSYGHWISVQGLGYSASAMALMPFDAHLNSDFSKNPFLEYDFKIEKSDSATVQIDLLPTHPSAKNRGLRVAVQIDDSKPKIYDLKTQGRSEVWKGNVLRNQAIIKFRWKFSHSGNHQLRIIAVDPDVVIDRIMIDLNPYRQLYGVGL